MDIDELRRKLDAIDDNIVRLYLERMKTVEDIAKAKKNSHLPISDGAREGAIVSRLTCGLSEKDAAFIKELYSKIFCESKKYQSSVIEAEEK